MARVGPQCNKKKTWIKTLIIANDLHVTHHSHVCAHMHNPPNANRVQNKFWSSNLLLILQHVSTTGGYHPEYNTKILSVNYRSVTTKLLLS
jgi:hypothetical protein